MRSSKTLVLYLLALAISGCASPDDDRLAADLAEAPPVADAAVYVSDVACTCGEPSADLHGCSSAACIAGVGDPDNPLCACGPLIASAGGDGTTRLVSNGMSDLAALEPQVLLDATGKKIRGRILSDDGERVTVAFELKDGTKGRQTLRYSQLDPRTVYRLHLGRVALDDGPAQFELAEFAASAGLYDAALRHYLQAADADHSLFEKVDQALASLREDAAATQIERGRTAMRKGDLDRAQRHLSEALTEFPDTQAVADADPLLAELGDLILEQRREQEAALAEHVAKRLAPARERHAKALDHMSSGIAEGRSPTRSIGHLRKAEAEFDNARRRLANLRKKRSTDAELAADIDTILDQVESDFVRNELHLAGRYLQRGSYKSAHGAVDRILAIDPAHGEALALRSRILEAERYDEWDRRDRWWRRRWVGGGWVRPGWRSTPRVPRSGRVR